MRVPANLPYLEGAMELAFATDPGKGLTDAPAGSLRNIYLVVTDIEAARRSLLERGVEVGDIRHKTPIGAWDGGFAPGLDPERNDYASFAPFSDPDGNSWVLQERGATMCDEEEEFPLVTLKDRNRHGSPHLGGKNGIIVATRAALTRSDRQVPHTRIAAQ